MITRIFIDNYRCFSNFEYRPGNLQLILGENGTGKTSVFDVLEAIRAVIAQGRPCDEAFPTSSVSAWESRTAQRFELDLRGNGGEYQYGLVLEQLPLMGRCRIQREGLTRNGKPLYLFDGEEVQLFRDDGSAASQFPFKNTQSALSNIPPRPENTHLTWFLNRIAGIRVFSPDPLRMKQASLAERRQPDRRLEELVSWLRHLIQERADFGAALLKLLSEVIAGLKNVRLETLNNNVRELQCDFRFESESGLPDRAFRLPFDALSDGERMLIAVHAILLAGVNEDATLCLDEPDNYVTLREIQPWLVLLCDAVEDRSGQCLVVSHHPELIDYFAVERAVVFRRDPAGVVRAEPFRWNKDEDILSAAELVARGWK